MVAPLAHSLRVVRSVRMATARRHLGVALLVVARLAHEFGAVLLVQVLANELVHQVLYFIAFCQLFKTLDVVAALRALQVQDELLLHLADGLLLFCLGAFGKLRCRRLCLWEDGELLCHLLFRNTLAALKIDDVILVLLHLLLWYLTNMLLDQRHGSLCLLLIQVLSIQISDELFLDARNLLDVSVELLDHDVGVL